MFELSVDLIVRSFVNCTMLLLFLSYSCRLIVMVLLFFFFFFYVLFFFQAEDGIRYLVRSRGLGDVYKRQLSRGAAARAGASVPHPGREAVGRPPLSRPHRAVARGVGPVSYTHLTLPTSDLV